MKQDESDFSPEGSDAGGSGIYPGTSSQPIKMLQAEIEEICNAIVVSVVGTQLSRPSSNPPLVSRRS